MRFFANMPIIIKALFVVAVPLVMLGVFMLDEIKQAYKNEASMQAMLQVTDLSGAAAALVGELQKERGISAGFLGSSGKKFSDNMKLQQGATDKTISELKIVIGKNAQLFDAFPSLRGLSDHFIMDLDQLKGIRQSVRKLDITVDDNLDYYIDLVDDIMQISKAIRIIYTFGPDSDSVLDGSQLIVPNAKFSGLLSSFILLGRAGEAAGIERAVLSNAFGLDHFGPGMYERFVSLRSLQRHMLYEFSLQSPESIQRMFSSIYGGEAVTEVDRFRDIAIKKARQGGFDVDPEQWFRISTNRIELLHRIEAEIIELIRAYSRLGVEQAGNHVRIILIRGVLAILIAAGLSIWAAWLLLLGIRRASQAVQSIEAGEYDVPVVVRGNDEMGRMLAGVERMRLSLMATEEARSEQQKKAHARLDALLQAKDELHGERDLIERLLAAMPSILIAIDSKGEVSLWNDVAEETFGLAGEAVMGLVFSSLTITWDWQEIKRSMEESEALFSSLLENVKFRRLDGTDGFLDLTINAVMEDGQHNGFLLIASDKTERLQLENQLQIAQKMEAVGELAAGVAHEINTPLQYVGDNLRFLKDSFEDMIALSCRYQKLKLHCTENNIAAEMITSFDAADEQADLEFLIEEIPGAITQSLDGVDKSSSIVSAMKEFSHPGQKEQLLTDINHVLDNTITVTRNEWKYVADLETEFDPDLPMIQCLPEINQVFLNMIINAAHAIEEKLGKNSPEKGQIFIRTSFTDHHVQIEIADTGAGIPEEIRQKIFDLFFTTKEVGSGTGQGLYISHKIVVEQHGGFLELESEVGKGTSFFIRLPIAGLAQA